jgi:hypothetical protein
MLDIILLAIGAVFFALRARVRSNLRARGMVLA